MPRGSAIVGAWSHYHSVGCSDVLNCFTPQPVAIAHFVTGVNRENAVYSIAIGSKSISDNSYTLAEIMALLRYWEDNNAS